MVMALELKVNLDDLKLVDAQEPVPIRLLDRRKLANTIYAKQEQMHFFRPRPYLWSDR
jgi:hypothetical protein